MISAGRNVQSATDPLVKVQLRYVYDALRNPKPEVEMLVRQLRQVRQISSEQYSKQKRKLPYIVAAMFSPAFRRKENFAYTEYFIIDIDHITDKDLDVAEVRSRIEADSRTMLCFLSPSEDGLKVVMRLAERCYDAGQYSLFYKAFVAQYSKQMGLSQVIDACTCDVSRACFMSIDANAYYNPNADTVDIKMFVDADNPLFTFDAKRAAEVSVSKLAAEQPKTESADKCDAEALAHIKAILKQNKAKIEPKPVYVPEILNDIMDDMKVYVQDMGVVINEVANIQYGKKIRMSLGGKKAEVNLFYGKRGFTVVASPRCGTDAEFNSVCAELIDTYTNLISAK